MRKKWILLVCILFVLFASSVWFVLIDSGNIQEGNEYGDLGNMPLEMVISRRMSIHYGNYYNLSAPVPWELVSEVLWAASGYSLLGRTVPTLSGYPIVIYVCNETAAYKFIPETQSFTLWKEGDYRGLSATYPAPMQLYIAFNINICEDVYWGNAESGCAIQSIYLIANALDLGTVCQGGLGLNRTYIHQKLGLPQNEKVLYKMPLGHPLPPYTDYQNLVPTTRPSSPELPEIQDSTVSLEDALNSVFSSHEWSEDPVTKQELSQVLWASYGYSYYEDNAVGPGYRHRTVPSAKSYYPMRIYVANSSGVYEYIPKQHTITTIVTEDRRPNIATASGNPWASSAPLLIAMAWDDTEILTVETTYIEVGLIAQNVYLESAAWGLITDWGTADANEEAMREALGITGETNLHPASIITVGHPDIMPPTISILSPENKRYTVNDVPLTFTVSKASSWIGYSLDGQSNVTITGNKTLTGLSDGIHTVTVYANDTAGNMGYSETVYFTIQTSPVDTTPPSISIVSPENKTYDTTGIPLTFTIDESVLWIAYSLDNKANVSITGNITLHGLSDSSHSVIVYARDTVENIGASEIIHFSIKTQQAEPFPTWIVAAIIITGVGATLLVYFAKIKKATEKVK